MNACRPEKCQRCREVASTGKFWSTCLLQGALETAGGRTATVLLLHVAVLPGVTVVFTALAAPKPASAG
jgi:hypothetical protein